MSGIRYLVLDTMLLKSSPAVSIISCSSASKLQDRLSGSLIFTLFSSLTQKWCTHPKRCHPFLNRIYRVSVVCPVCLQPLGLILSWFTCSPPSVWSFTRLSTVVVYGDIGSVMTDNKKCPYRFRLSSRVFAVLFFFHSCALLVIVSIYKEVQSWTSS